MSKKAALSLTVLTLGTYSGLEHGRVEPSLKDTVRVLAGVPLQTNPPFIIGAGCGAVAELPGVTTTSIFCRMRVYTLCPVVTIGLRA